MDGISLNLLGNQLIDIYQKIMRGEDLTEHHRPSYLSYMEKNSNTYSLPVFKKTVHFGLKHTEPFRNTFHWRNEPLILDKALRLPEILSLFLTP